MKKIIAFIGIVLIFSNCSLLLTGGPEYPNELPYGDYAYRDYFYPNRVYPYGNYFWNDYYWYRRQPQTIIILPKKDNDRDDHKEPRRVEPSRVQPQQNHNYGQPNRGNAPIRQFNQRGGRR